MAISISLHNLSSVLTISVFLLFFFPFSVSHRLMSNRCPSHESEALLRFKAAFNDSHGDLSSWVNGTDCCTHWRGISCDNHTNHVVSVEIGYLFNECMIFESLCQLHFLTSLSIHGARDSMEAYLPALAILLLLTHLSLSINQLSGSIPPSLGNLSSLTDLNLSDNDQLSGNIPDSLGNLSLLESLDIRNNQLIGTIPASFGSLSLLQELDISNNQLSGTIPPSFAQLSSLTYFYAHGNRFNEIISSSSFPASLVWLYLSLNHY